MVISNLDYLTKRVTELAALEKGWYSKERDNSLGEGDAINGDTIRFLRVVIPSLATLVNKVLLTPNKDGSVIIEWWDNIHTFNSIWIM